MKSSFRKMRRLPNGKHEVKESYECTEANTGLNLIMSEWPFIYFYSQTYYINACERATSKRNVYNDIYSSNFLKV